MHLFEALKMETVGEVDPTRPLRLGPLELGSDAAAEAVRILEGGDFPREATYRQQIFTRAMYWSIAHKTEGQAEVFGFPESANSGLPTAIELALVRATAALSPEHHDQILKGGVEIALGPRPACNDFQKVIEVVARPLVGKSLLFQEANQAIIDEDIATRLTKVTLNCLANSFRTSPLKFRFLELYRMMEARFLADIKAKLFTSFDSEPGLALADAGDALKSELNQITCLAETQQDAFEACWTELERLKDTNRFTAALFRGVAKKGATRGGKWKTGAALVYQVRCAIVHAGERDIIFENFLDGECVIEAILPHIERAALLLVGIELR